MLAMVQAIVHVVRQDKKVKYCHIFDFFQDMKHKSGTHVTFWRRGQVYEFQYHNLS